MSNEVAKPPAIVDSAAGVASNATGAAVASLPSSSSTNPSPIDLSQDEEAFEEESFQMVPISNHPLRLSVVGIRYYRGVAHPGEYVQLVREPHNPYDRNAVRVDNMHGEKVGHIKKEQAAMLAPVMDNMNASVKLDGTIPYAGNQFMQPCDCELLARVNVGEDPAEAIERVLEQMNRYPSSRQLVQRLRPGNSKSSSATVPRATAPVVQRKNVDWRTQQKDLDDMFEKQTKEQLENLPFLQMPSQLTNVTLFDYQVQGIKWLVHNETSTSLAPFYKQVRESGQSKWLCEITNCSQTNEPKRIQGGILADEMGLGKTIQTIGLILCNPPEDHVYPDGIAVPFNVAAADEDAMGDDDDEEEDKKPAAAPNVTMLRKYNVKTLQLVLSKAGLVATGKKGDLVESCKQGLASGTLTGDDFTPENIDELANYIPPAVGDSIAAPTPKANVATLVVCPVSVMHNWVHQIESHVKPGVLRVAMYHGPDRHLLIPRIRSNEIDVLIVSYNTLAAEVPSDKKSGKENVQPPAAKKRKSKNGSILEETFYRVILDEAQHIRTSKTRAFKAVSSVRADRRLCLTGTPFVNKVDDINSLLSFLGVEPLNDSNVFRRAITQPIQNGDEMGLARLRTTMACIALRRSKALANLKMTAKTVSILSVEFPEGFHKRVHDCLFATARAIFEAHLQEGEGEALRNYTSIFETLLRIRQSCCSARLVPKTRRDSAEQVLRELQNRGGKPLTCEEGKALMEKLRGAFESEEAASEVPECSICLEEMEEDAAIILRSCLHIFCASCIGKVNVDYNANARCPLCRSSFKKTDMIKKSAASAAATADSGEPAYLSMEDDEIGMSPKVAALLEAIKEMKPDEKGVIFSQFTSFLDVVGHAMQAAGHTFTRIDGSKSAGDRIKAMSEFNKEDDGPRFILCSLHAAGTGINLTRGSWAFMLDTWWNESVENQAMDRIHRLGQKRDVRVYRLVMKDSIEERIIALQEAKAALGKGTMQKLKPEEKRKARITALKDLFLIGKTEEDDEV